MFDEWDNESKYNLFFVMPLTIFSLAQKGAFLLISGGLSVNWWLWAPEDSLETVSDSSVSQMSLFVPKFSPHFINSVTNVVCLCVVNGVICNY